MSDADGTRAAPPPAEVPIGCYYLPSFWVGASRIRREGKTPLDDAMTQAIAELYEATAAGRRDIADMPAYRLWVGIAL